ncbi:hypothetical protein ACN9MG_07755 [Burkholderia ambifaria]|jgi:hypothetical protein|uniref:hypothetical protein n=1 Tax=Burkholderia ambifaria TaxID=152480 RepID=UPI00158F2433|nr:hypothetical protein [Burkholderia ambifaria]
MLYRFGSTRNPSDQYLRVYSEHAATLADCGALHRIRRWRFVAIVDEKEKPFSGSMIRLRRIRLVRRLWFAFSTCALFGFHSARRDGDAMAMRWRCDGGAMAVRSPQQARVGCGNGRAARCRRGLSIRVPAH